MGARPLKRAIDRYLLAPLAMTIVKHQYPQGDQFLFVSTQRDRLRVQFVDPDAPPEAAEVYGGEESLDDLVTGPAAATVDEAALDAIRTMRLENIVLQARGSAAEIECMRAHVAALQGTVEDEAWQAAKKDSLAQMSSVDFWNSPRRFSVLGEAEYLDRIEAGVSRSASLFQRLAGTGGDGRRHYPVDLVRQLGQQLFLLCVACDDVAQSREHEAFLALESSGPAAEASAFGKRLGDMYQAWARKRRMQCVVLDESSSGATPYRLMLAVSGYGAHSLLESESGLHVYEVPEGDSGRFQRHQARVRVVPQPDEPVQGKGSDRRARLLVQAREVLNKSGAPQRRIVRRYRDTPSPLVRDGVRGWRTGRIDLVLAGNFDLFCATGEAESVH